MDNLTTLKTFGHYLTSLLILVWTDHILKLACNRYVWVPGTEAQAVCI